MRTRAPRDLTDLPYAHRLELFEADLEREGDYEWLHIDGRAFNDIDAGMARFNESALSEVTFTGGRLRRAHLDTVWMHNIRTVGTDLAETTWLDTECLSSLLAGTQIHGAQMRRAVFHNCKFDSVNLRAAKLREVAFVDCLLRDVDFAGATLTDVSFPGTILDRVDFTKATLARVDLRGALALGIISGAESLRGAVVTTPQLLDLAPSLAQHVGLTVDDN
ncbi:pentapeptide repeat-containing protein [Kitasatospora sp. RB6PN24]|uniref:pentapeptide repeat-containing protein n=1 Tax=Kitasatospora humi TaxID=2893891 RepID=UPI001E333C22|nr:pentapeptide repeat-containing protein [Kitasatospora humi]MCC9310077.1 pentapeptide repeat-containing protein [Kitasatospora humi]